MAKAKTPADLTITPRDRRFGRDTDQSRWWFGGDPIATAFHNALSITFPKGEAFFIDSVKAFRDGASPRLAEEIRAIVATEEVRGVLVERGFEIMNTTPEQFASGYRREFEVITQRIRAFGIEAQ